MNKKFKQACNKLAMSILLMSVISCNNEADQEVLKSAGDLVDKESQSFLKGSTTIWSNDFVYNDGWVVDKTPRELADVNGDGKADIIGFDYDGVKVSLSTGSEFAAPQNWISKYGYNQSWRPDHTHRTVADVNGDGKADVIGFGYDATFVSLSTGTGFAKPQRWSHGAFTYNKGNWRHAINPIKVVDVNNDGRADIVGFGNDVVYVSLSTGSSFGTPQVWIDKYSNNQGWRPNDTYRTVADLNNDGRADIIGFGYDAVFVSLSTGRSFSKPQRWSHGAFTKNKGNWMQSKNPLDVEDINGDGKADIVGFGNDYVYISYSVGTAFATPFKWINNYVYNHGGWRVEKHPRMSADVNGDGKSDIVAFGNNYVFVELSNL